MGITLSLSTHTIYMKSLLISHQLIQKQITKVMGSTCHNCIRGETSGNARDKFRTQGSHGQYVEGLKGRVKYEVDDQDDFLHHHLMNQSALSQYASMHKIRARQIIEHFMFSDLNNSKDSGSVSTSKLTEFALKAWFQRTFLFILERGEKNFLEKNQKYAEVRQQIAEEYIFEIYQMGQFINAGFGKFSTVSQHITVPLSVVLLNSDSALFALLSKLQEKYPLVSDVPKMQLPDVPNESIKLNVLDLIDSKCYADPDNLNRQSLMDDLKTIIDKSNDFYMDFKDDMKEMLGGSTETDCKVKRKVQNEQVCYSAQAVRRCFVKWSQKMIDLIPEVYTVKQFIEFVKSKKKMADQFIFKGTVSPTTHQHVIDSLSELLEALKYKSDSREKREEFGLFIYDFLRCKTTRNTGEEVVALLNTMKTTKMTKSGKKFEVFRVKNRLKWATRDLLINFRYGDNLVGQAQLCIDVPHDSPQIAKQIKFRHYLYELERGLFGPTFEMIMQFEDLTRKDIVVTLEAEGEIKRRTAGNNANKVGIALRKCPQNHEMVAFQGNIFSQTKIAGQTQNEQTAQCDFCFKTFQLKHEYHYCYYCSVFYCIKCLNEYEQTDKKTLEYSCRDHSVFRDIESPEELRSVCEGERCAIVIFVRASGTPSNIFLDSIAYFYSAFRHGESGNRKIPVICKIRASNQKFKDIVDKYHIDRTPTTLIIDGNLQAQVVLVGSSFHQIPSFFKVRARILADQPKGIPQNCSICQAPMVKQSKQKSKKQNQSKCQICMGTNKIDNIRDIVKMINFHSIRQDEDMVCSNNHIRCFYCSYLTSNDPSYYRDMTGRSYLSNAFNTKEGKCTKGHVMKLVSQPKGFCCISCKKNYGGNVQEFINVCGKCQEYMCTQCSNADRGKIKDNYKKQLMRNVQIVAHYVQNRLEESYPCGCGKYFLKVYQSRKIQNRPIINHIAQFIDQGAVRWNCFVCQKEETKLRVHLACFYCSYAQKIFGKPSHLEICINCALSSGLIGWQLPKRVYQQSTSLKCGQGHEIIKTSLRRGGQLFVQCSFCRKQYYPNTQRYECRTCDKIICEKCSEKELIDGRNFTIKRRCKKRHDLEIVRKAPKLQFCTVCKRYLRNMHFKCPKEGCRYFICLNCNKQQSERASEMASERKMEEERSNRKQ